MRARDLAAAEDVDDDDAHAAVAEDAGEPIDDAAVGGDDDERTDRPKDDWSWTYVQRRGTDAPDERSEKSEPGFAEGAVMGAVVGALVGALVLGLIWLTTTTLGDDPAAADADEAVLDAGSALTQAGSSADTTEQQELLVPRTRLDRCRTADQRLQRSLRAAGPAMDQWQVHVGAMNKLVVGAITLQQASDFWNQTRQAAKQKIGRFDEAMGTVRSSGLNCPVVDRLGNASEELRSCAQRVDADERAAQAAAVAILTWSTHVKDMDMLRMGHLSPADATAAWLASWEQGLQEIRAYQAEARAARLAGTCSP